MPVSKLYLNTTVTIMMLRKLSILIILLLTTACQAGFIKPVRGHVFVDRGNLKNRGLVGSWPFNEGTGPNVGDVSGNGNTGNFLDSNLSWASFDFGQSVYNPGTSNGILATTPSQITYDGSWTVIIVASALLWNTGSESIDRTLIDFKDAGNNRILTAGVINGHFTANRSPNTSLEYTSTIPFTIAPGTHHFAIVHDKNSGSTRPYIYVDGIKVDSLAPTWSYGINGSASQCRLMGRLNNIYDFLGYFGVVTFFDRPLSLSGIQANYRRSINENYFNGTLMYDVGGAPPPSTGQVIFMN